MTLNARRSLADSLLKINTDDKQNSEKLDSETSKLQPVNLTDTAGVHQRAADSLQGF